MKATCSEEKTSKSYPALLKNTDGVVILADCSNKGCGPEDFVQGIVLFGGRYHKTGASTATSFVHKDFEPFTGSITLEN